MELRDYQRLTDAVESTRRAEAKAAGAVEVFDRQLEEFGRDAAKSLAKLEREIERGGPDFDEQLERFWADHDAMMREAGG